MAAAALAFAIVLVLSPVVVAGLRRRGLVDRPNERSSHTDPTPRGGGVAPALGAAAALLVTGGGGDLRVAVVVGIVAFGLIGLGEDVVGVPVVVRLVLQAVAAALAAPWALAGLDGPVVVRAVVVAVALLFVVSYVNGFNFMDGINGISVAQVAVAGTAWYVIGRVEELDAFATGGAVLAAAALAFAPYNFPRAQVFLGDVGSYAFGAALAVVAVVGLREGLAPEAVMAPLLLYLADTGTTLVKRFRAGQPWFRPHRDHTYQQFVRMGWSHTATTLTVAGVMVSVSVLGAVSLLDVGAARVAADLGIALLLGIYLKAPALVRRIRPEAALA